MHKDIEITKALKLLSSEEAAQFLINMFPIESDNYSEIFQYVSSYSWSRNSQMQLADYYLQKMPFATSKPYEIFLSYMSLNSFLPILLKHCVLASKEDCQLVSYHITPILTHHIKSDKDTRVVNDFLENLNYLIY